jgi:phospholipase C
MLENRSFDHLFGYRKGVDGLTGTETNLLNPVLPPGPTNGTFKVSNAEPYSVPVGEGPTHSLDAVTLQLFGTKTQPPDGTVPSNNGFVASYRSALFEDHVSNPTVDQIQVVMEAFAPGTLPALEALADQFCLCDRWFCEVPGPTMPNRMFIHMGSSGGYVHNVWQHTFDDLTIYNCVENGGKTWATYDFDQNEVRQFSKVSGKSDCFRSFEDHFAADITSGALPNYSFIVPRFFAKDGVVNSMHGPYDARPADQLVADVYNALISNPAVWNETVLIVTMDEHGGFYDHVPPPWLPAAALDNFSSPQPGDESWVPAFKFNRLGLRVPTIIASPLIPADKKVDSTEYRHTSVLATAMKMFGLTDTLTKRVETANTFEGLFSLAVPRATTPITGAESVSAHPQTPSTFASGSVKTQGEFGLDSLQEEMVHGVDALTKPDNKEALGVGNLPPTQAEASDFIRRRHDQQFGTRGSAPSEE